MSNEEELLTQIRQQLASVPDFGQLQIHIKKHVGSFSNTDYVKMTSYRYTDNNPNVSCTADIFSLIKQISDAGLNGSVGLSITFKKGKADLMQVQDFKKL